MQHKKTVIITDSTCDLSDQQLLDYGIHMIPLRVICKNAEYRDRIEIQPEELYGIMENELPKTSLPQPEDIMSLLDELVEKGVEEAVYFGISSGLSGTSQLMKMMAASYEARLKLHVVDSFTLSMALGMMVLEAAKTLEAGGTVEQVIEAAMTVRNNQTSVFVIRTLEFLRKGGRIGKVEGMLGNILQLKPVIFVNDDGIYETIAKARGYKNALETMVQELVNRFGKKKINLSVVHGRAYEEAQRMLERLKGSLTIAEAYIRPASPVLAIHTGPGLLGVIANAVVE